MSDTQEKAIIALLNEPTIQRAAAAAGVGERTLHRWLTHPEFVRAWCQARRQAFSQAVALAHRYTPLAVQTLARICNNEKALDSDRIRAAAIILHTGRESIEIEDIQARLEMLETQGADGTTRPPVIDAEAHVTEPNPQGPITAPVVVPPPRVRRGRKKTVKRRPK